MRSLLRRSILAAILLASVTHAEAATRGGTLVFARNADSLFLDPVLNDDNVDIWVLTSLHSTLILPTPDTKGLRPGLATSWTASEDGKTLTLKLRAGAKFSDGSPVTADDVVWSLNRARDPKAGIWNFLLASVDAVSAPAPDTVVLALKHPDLSLPAALATFNAAILPSKLFEAQPGKTDEEKARAFADHPVGAGPFVLASWQRGTQMVLKRNPYYWQKDETGESLPYLDEVDLKVVTDDATRVLQLQAGQIDAAEFVPYARVKELQGNASLSMALFPSTKVDYIQMNVRPKLLDGTPNPLSDEKVRQALNFAVNKRAVIQIVTHGLGTPMHSYMASTTPLYHDVGEAYPFDAKKAKQLLTEAGYGSGFNLTVLAQAGNADQAALLAAVQQMWTPLGVKLSIQQMDIATLDDRYHKNDFQLRAGYWTNDIADPNEITSYFAYYPTNECQQSGWKSDRATALFEQSQVEQDAAKRADDYKELQQLYMGAAPILFLYQTPFAAAALKKVKGFYQLPLGNDVFETTYIEK
jgi:peptide/nickel transport system substrate-binding protein